jgi:hypothetical protein
MPGLILPKVKKLLVVGPCYDKIEKLARAEVLIPQYDWVIFNSGLCQPPDNLYEINRRIDKMKQLIATGKVIYVAGRSDYLLLNNLQIDLSLEKWIRSLYNLVIIEFSTRNVIITDGGIPTTATARADLLDNLEVSFISRLGDKPWQHSYNGSLGYVISNNPLTDQPPQYYKHSMQLGNLYAANNSVYAQEVDEISLKKSISL